MQPPTPQELRLTLQRRIEREQAGLSAERAALRRQLPDAAHLLTAMGARSVWAIGSLAWGGWHAHSDIDLAVEGLTAGQRQPAEDRLARLFGRVVELFRLEELPADFAERIRTEGEEWRP